MVQQLMHNPRYASMITETPQFKGIAKVLRQMSQKPLAPINQYTTMAAEPVTGTSDAYQFQWGDNIRRKGNNLEYVILNTNFWGDSIDRNEWKGEAMNTNGMMIDPFIQAYNNIRYGLSRQMTKLFLQNTFTTTTRRKVQIEIGENPLYMTSFPTTNVVSNYANSSIDRKFGAVIKNFFAKSSQVMEGKIYLIASWDLWWKFADVMGTSYTSAILDIGVRDSLFDDAEYGLMQDTKTGIHWVIVPNEYLQTEVVGGQLCYALPFFKDTAYTVSMDIEISQQVPHLDEWGQPETYAMGTLFAMTRKYDQVAGKIYVNIQQNSDLG